MIYCSMLNRGWFIKIIKKSKQRNQKKKKWLLSYQSISLQRFTLEDFIRADLFIQNVSISMKSCFPIETLSLIF